MGMLVGFKTYFDQPSNRMLGFGAYGLQCLYNPDTLESVNNALHISNNKFDPSYMVKEVFAKELAAVN